MKSDMEYLGLNIKAEILPNLTDKPLDMPWNIGVCAKYYDRIPPDTIPLLIEYQKKAYKKFYMRPHIIWYNFKRAGLKAGLLNSWAFLKSDILQLEP